MYEIMEYINNHFIPAHNVPEYKTYEIMSDGIVGSFSETYIPGMYVVIRHSYLNDGVYKITGVTDSKLTVEETLKAENTGEEILICASSPPQSFIDLSNQIGNFNQSVGATSESIDDYSVSYNNDGSWQSAYASKLSQYRKLYDDIGQVARRLSWW